MGRQLEIVLSEEQELALLAFMRASADVQVIRGFAPTQDELFVQSFEPRGEGNHFYCLWNRSFNWEPRFSLTRTDPPSVYVSNKSAAPLIEYSRHTQHGPGRIYWAKHFSAPAGPAYDVAAFEGWYNSVARWLKNLRTTERPG
jgi:hypothetical protein